MSALGQLNVPRAFIQALTIWLLEERSKKLEGTSSNAERKFPSYDRSHHVNNVKKNFTFPLKDKEALQNFDKLLGKDRLLKTQMGCIYISHIAYDNNNLISIRFIPSPLNQASFEMYMIEVLFNIFYSM